MSDLHEFTDRPAKPVPARGPVMPTRNSGWATLPADRSFKVLQPSRTPAQLSLFPPPGLAPRTGR
jgi:hypothetical protein